MVNQQEKSCVLDIRVKDTGIGIPAEKLGSIFNSFTQASGDTTRKFGGTGLGLTIAHELVTQQKGDIQVRSVVGSGSEFIVTLPFELQPIQSGQAASDSMDYSFKELIGYKILMAEDHPMNQLLAKKLFKKWNCEIEFAHNGIKALEKLRYQSFDLILMDLQMPEMDGYQTTSYIRERLEEPKRSIPIIAITAHALAGEKEKCLSLGMQDYISKPFDQEVLYRKILEQLSSSSVSER
jgi:CheY-like chemotaxis protein